MELLSFKTKSLLEKATFNKAYTDIPNNHKAVVADVERWQEVSKLLGINFDETEYTLTVSRDGKVYTPSVKSNDKGEACLVWGKVVKPLSELKGTGTLEGDKYTYLEWVVEDSEGNDVVLDFFLMLSKEVKADPKTDKLALRKAYKNGTLGSLLIATFTKNKSLSELADGEYEVTNVRVGSYQGKTKFSILVDGYGWYGANNKVSNRILADYDETTGKYIGTISKEYPAVLDVRATDKKTSEGKPIMDARLTTQEDLELPVFDFTDTSVEVNGTLVF